MMPLGSAMDTHLEEPLLASEMRDMLWWVAVSSSSNLDAMLISVVRCDSTQSEVGWDVKMATHTVEASFAFRAEFGGCVDNGGILVGAFTLPVDDGEGLSCEEKQEGEECCDAGEGLHVCGWL